MAVITSSKSGYQRDRSMRVDSLPEISKHIWETKYRHPTDTCVADTWGRVARAVASVEENAEYWEKQFYELLEDFRFLPGGRILANAGTERTSTTMCNCFVMGTIPDSIEGIFDTVKEAALTQKQGGGVGYDFSTIRPSGAYIKGVESSASGPISFMQVADATCRTIMSAGGRRGAQIGVLRCDHPDIEAFIAAKRGTGALQMFNLSVAITDKFMEAVRDDLPWELVFGGKVYRTVQARQLMDSILRSAYDYAEPGVLFIDTANRLNNLSYCETFAAANPCGEQILPPYGACVLGSINLVRFVCNPFSEGACIDWEDLEDTVGRAVRFLDNVIDISEFPLPQQKAEAVAKRRIGLGFTGLADALIMIGERYGSAEALVTMDCIGNSIALSAYGASYRIGIEKGSFPLFDSVKYMDGTSESFVAHTIADEMMSVSMRNSHLLCVAPTGTTSLLAGNVSSGIEPVFAWEYTRKIRTGTGSETGEHTVQDYAYAMWRSMNGDKVLPPEFVTSADLMPYEHLSMQAAAQKWVDSAISKTINVPTGMAFEDFRDIYTKAWTLGLKGCTAFRPSEKIRGVMVKTEERPTGPKQVPVQTSLPVRPASLSGTTYKIRTPLSPDAFYVTVNNIEDGGSLRPYEVFINTKNLQHFSWIVAMTRLISAVFRREPDPSFLVDELKSIYDPAGGYFKDGVYVPSLPAELGGVIEKHLKALGIGTPVPVEVERVEILPSETVSVLNLCPKCKQPGLVVAEGCERCTRCDYSRCG